MLFYIRSNSKFWLSLGFLIFPVHLLKILAKSQPGCSYKEKKHVNDLLWHKIRGGWGGGRWGRGDADHLQGILKTVSF